MEQLSFFERAVRLVDKYGIFKIVYAIVFVALFLFVVIYVPNATKKYFDETTSKTIREEFNIRRMAHREEVEKRYAVQKEITNVLNSLINAIDCDRAYLIELHNGSENLNSIPFLHATVTYEVSKEGVDSFDEEFQNLTLSRYYLPTYLYNNFNFIGTIEELNNIDDKMGKKLEVGDIKYVGIITLNNEYSAWGYLGVSYVKGTRVPSSKVIMKHLMLSSQKINSSFAQ